MAGPAQGDLREGRPGGHFLRGPGRTPRCLAGLVVVLAATYSGSGAGGSRAGSLRPATDSGHAVLAGGVLRGRYPRLWLRGGGSEPAQAGAGAEEQVFPGIFRAARKHTGEWLGPFERMASSADGAPPALPIEFVVAAKLERLKGPADPHGADAPPLPLEQRLARSVCDSAGVPPQVSRASPWLPLHTSADGRRLLGAAQRAAYIRALAGCDEMNRNAALRLADVAPARERADMLPADPAAMHPEV
jgi:hypothetical protein